MKSSYVLFPYGWIGGSAKYPEPWDNQIEKLQAKNCDCVIEELK